MPLLPKRSVDTLHTSGRPLLFTRYHQDDEHDLCHLDVHATGKRCCGGIQISPGKHVRKESHAVQAPSGICRSRLADRHRPDRTNQGREAEASSPRNIYIVTLCAVALLAEGLDGPFCHGGRDSIPNPRWCGGDSIQNPLFLRTIFLVLITMFPRNSTSTNDPTLFIKECVYVCLSEVGAEELSTSRGVWVWQKWQRRHRAAAAIDGIRRNT